MWRIWVYVLYVDVVATCMWWEIEIMMKNNSQLMLILHFHKYIYVLCCAATRYAFYISLQHSSTHLNLKVFYFLLFYIFYFFLHWFIFSTFIHHRRNADALVCNLYSLIHFAMPFTYFVFVSKSIPQISHNRLSCLCSVSVMCFSNNFWFWNIIPHSRHPYLGAIK